MAKIMFIKPQMEVTAVWDPVRTCSYLGMWFLASYLKEKGHQVRYLDEVIRNNGLQKREMFRRILKGNRMKNTPLNLTYGEFHAQKMKDFHSLSPRQFVKKYTAFKGNAVVRDMVRIGNPISDTLSEIEKFNPDFIGIPIIASANHLPALRLAKAIKEKFQQIKIIVGGQHVSAMSELIIREAPFIDFLCIGDAITIIHDIVEGKTKDKIVYGGFQKMDKYPLLDPKIIEENNYPIEPTYTYTTQGRKSVDFMFSRGCYRKCEFCVAGSQKGNHITAIDYKKVDKQLKIFKEHGYEEIVVQDDAFLWDPTHVKKHLPRILKLMKKYGFYWQNNGGVEFEGMSDFVTEQLIKYNKKGKGRCTSLYIPFNPRAWNKGKSAAGTMTSAYKRNFENLKRLRKEAGIYIFTSEIIGTPEHTIKILREDIELHKKMIKRGYIDAALTLVATLLPGTKWYADHKNYIVNIKDWPGYSLFVTHYRPEKISHPKIIEEFMIRRYKELWKYQKTYVWGTAFPREKGTG